MSKKRGRSYSKEKGAEFERNMARFLSKWITKNRRDDIFWRTAMSGGAATIGKRKNENVNRVAQSGDLTCIDPRGYWLVENFFIELKFYKNLELDRLVKNTGKLLKFWSKACSEATSFGKKPMLIFKQNHFPIMICLDFRGVEFFDISIHADLVVPKYDLNIFEFKRFCRDKKVQKRIEELSKGETNELAVNG